MHGAQEDVQTARAVVELLKIERFGFEALRTPDGASSVASARSARVIWAGVIMSEATAARARRRGRAPAEWREKTVL